MNHNKIEIINFAEGMELPIKTLNYEWLEKYFKLEPSDILSLSNPKTEIIDQGGFIFYAKMNADIVGTAALLRKTDATYEIGKMAVSEKSQGFRIGTLLLEHCIEFAKQEQIKTLILYSNTMLEPAIHLYRKYGFVEIPLEKGLYDRANIKMEKQLQI